MAERAVRKFESRGLPSAQPEIVECSAVVSIKLCCQRTGQILVENTLAYERKGVEVLDGIALVSSLQYDCPPVCCWGTDCHYCAWRDSIGGSNLTMRM